MHYLLFYEKAPDHVEREPAHQEAHRRHVFAAVDRGELLLGGPLHDPLNGDQALLFQARSMGAVEAFAKADPYVVNGIVSMWRVRTWQTVVGPEAAEPLDQDVK